ncbi:MAG TPA: hypothetical protein PKH69_00870 [Thiobacillaceae bacterium]|nr:hypothetical protein [Thiobacillaceae bacterium]
MRQAHGHGLSVLLLAALLAAAAMAWAEGPGNVLPTHVCSPRMGDYNDRQAFIGFEDGSVQWCLSRSQCIRLTGLPARASRIVAFSCEREQYVWVIHADGAVFRCAGAVGRKACEAVPLQP